MSDALIFGSLAGVYAFVGGLIYWVAHTRVDHKTCDRTHEAVERQHQNIREYIHDTEERSEQRHKELRQDIREIKDYIKNERPRT
jgi:fatty-acid desaturase